MASVMEDEDETEVPPAAGELLSPIAELAANLATPRSAVDELRSTVSQCTDSITSAATELYAQPTRSTATDLKQAVLQGKDQVAADVSRLRDSIPTAAELTAAVSTAHVDTRLVDRLWLLGLFVPAPRWPPERLTVNVFLKRARPILTFALLVACLLMGAGLLLAFFFPLLLVLVPPALAGSCSTYPRGRDLHLLSS